MNHFDFQKVFSKLSHIKALSAEKNKLQEIVKNLILYSIVQRPESIINNDTDVAKIIQDVYGIPIRESVIQPAFDKLRDSGEVIRNINNKSYIVSLECSNKISTRLQDAKATEIKIQQRWEEELLRDFPNLYPIKEVIWDCIQSYLSLVFEQHGVQSLLLLNPSAKITENEQKGLQILAKKSISSCNGQIEEEIFYSIVNNFISGGDELRISYIAQLVDSTFTSYALTSDAETTSYLNRPFKNVLLFLDTNFIFGVLNLHNNQEDSSALEILKELKKNKLGFNLVYHPLTLSEFQKAFHHRSNLIKGRKWSRESSRVALRLGGLNPIEEVFHKENLEFEIDPNLFLEKYEQVDIMLQDMGLEEYPTRKITDLEHGDIEYDISKYQDFYNRTRLRKEKGFYLFQHDIIVLREVRFLSGRKAKFLDCSAFFISSDFILAKFENEFFKQRWEVGLTLNPSVFLQIIRPFIVTDYESNKKFIETFSIPDFRTFEIDYSTTRNKVMQVLNDKYNGVSDETKLKILRNQILLGKVKQAENDYSKQLGIVEEQLSIENQALNQQVETIKCQLNEADQQKEKLMKENLGGQEDLSKLKEEIESLKLRLYETKANLPNEENTPEMVNIENQPKLPENAYSFIGYLMQFVPKRWQFIVALSIMIAGGYFLYNYFSQKNISVNSEKIYKSKDNRFVISGMIRLNGIIPPTGEISEVSIKGDAEVPPNSLNDGTYRLKNVVIPMDKLIEIEFRFKNGNTISKQIPVLDIDSNMLTAKIPMLNLVIPLLQNNSPKPSKKSLPNPEIKIEIVNQVGDGNIKSSN